MLLEEFAALTGFYPNHELYQQIEAEYIAFDGDKFVFCKQYKENFNGLASKIQHDATVAEQKKDQQYEEAINKLKDEKSCLKQRIQKLEAKLEKEQEWRPYEIKENVSQEDYLRLVEDKAVEKWSDEQCRILLYQWFGFAKERIRIVREVPVHEINRHRQIREVGTYDREPLYFASDMNYIRFDCGCARYELYNGELSMFYS